MLECPEYCTPILGTLALSVGVSPYMPLQVTGNVEELVTCWALMRFLPRVCERMSLELART